MAPPDNATQRSTSQQQRRAQEQERLQKEWSLRERKLGVLRQGLAIETDADRQFRLQEQINAEATALAELDTQLTALEQESSPAGMPQNLPYSGVIAFVGREAELEQIHHQLQQRSIVAISALSGMGGIGKTELALQYARKHCREGSYPGGLCWVRAREDMGTQIISFVRSCLELIPPDDLELVEKVRWCWGRWREGAALLIFDDVQQYDDVAPFLPPQDSRFKVLLTTRSHFGSPVQEI